MAVLLQTIPPTAVAPAGEAGGAQITQTYPTFVSGSGSSRETGSPRIHESNSSPEQDVVKVQVEPPGEIIVYRFMNQQGTLVLQVPPQQLLDLAQEISKELARKPAPQIPPEGGDHNGH